MRAENLMRACWERKTTRNIDGLEEDGGGGRVIHVGKREGVMVLDPGVEKEVAIVFVKEVVYDEGQPVDEVVFNVAMGEQNRPRMEYSMMHPPAHGWETIGGGELRERGWCHIA
jgi:hypothetical protein